MNKEEYTKYLQTAHWQKIRKKLLKKSECWRCGKRVNLQVHHLSYTNLGKEKDSELVILCSKCHKYIHFGKKKRKVSPYESCLRLKKLTIKIKHKEKKPKDWQRAIERAKKQVFIPCAKRYSKAKQY